MRSCPVEVTLKLIGSKWKLLILRNLLNANVQRFSELARGINGIDAMHDWGMNFQEQNGY